MALKNNPARISCDKCDLKRLGFLKQLMKPLKRLIFPYSTNPGLKPWAIEGICFINIAKFILIKYSEKASFPKPLSEKENKSGSITQHSPGF